MRQTILVIMIIAVLSLQAFAIEPQPLPDIELLNTEGKTVGSKSLVSSPRWLFIYIESGSRSQLNFLKELQMTENVNAVADRIVIVFGGGTQDMLERLTGSDRSLPQFAWYLDPQEQAFQLLPAKGTPVIFGIQDNTIEWALAGTLKDETMRSMLFEWVAY